MKRPIINLEINELPKEVFLDFIKKDKYSILSKLFNNKKIDVFETFAGDIPKKDLYPSQTWASMLTGNNFNDHKCYWYSDPLEKEDLLWNKLLKKGFSIGILGSLHSSKLPNNLYKNNKFHFYIPDCFSDQNVTKPKSYKNFQTLNSTLVGQSARKVNYGSLLNMVLKNILKIIYKPSYFGISFFSINEITKICFKVLFKKNLEYFRTAQFPLIGEIFINEISKRIPSYSSLFTNHLAGNMHRYWYASYLNQFSKKDIYKQNWIKRNKNAIFFPMKMIDNYLSYLIKKTSKYNPIIIITASMGQEARQDFCNNSDVEIQIDGKIEDISTFINRFSDFSHSNYKIGENIEIKRNMAPQYGFELRNNNEAKIFGEKINKFLFFLGFTQFKVDINLKSVVLTIDPWHDENIQRLIKKKKDIKLLKSYGFNFFKIDDHHSGAHTEKGIFAIINGDESLLSLVKEKQMKPKTINYLDFSKIIIKYFDS